MNCPSTWRPYCNPLLTNQDTNYNLRRTLLASLRQYRYPTATNLCLLMWNHCSPVFHFNWHYSVPRSLYNNLLLNYCYRQKTSWDEPNNRQGAVYKIKCSNCQTSYIGETGRNLHTRLTEHKQATGNGDANNHIAVHHQLTNHNIDWDSAQCLTYNTNYFQRLILESW